MTENQNKEIERIEDAVCIEYDVSLKELKSRSRFKFIVEARKVIVYLSLDVQITAGELMGRYNRSHCLRITYINDIKNMIEYNSLFRERFRKIKNGLTCNHHYVEYISHYGNVARICSKCKDLILEVK